MPRMPSGAPSGLASTTNAEPLALEANHLKPVQPPGVAVGRGGRLERGEVGAAGALGEHLGRLAGHSPAAKSSRTRSLTSSGANSSARRTTMSPPVPRAHIIPISAWSSR